MPKTIKKTTQKKPARKSAPKKIVKTKPSLPEHDLVIDRKKWLRGDCQMFEDDPESVLRDGGGRMCCLGFYLKSVGGKSITGIYEPMGLNKIPKDAEWLVNRGEFKDIEGNSKECDKLICVNDDGPLSENRREREIAKLFKKHGNVNVTFVGETPYAEQDR